MGGAVGLVGALFLPWYELRLYSWQGGCCHPDIDNPFYRLRPFAAMSPPGTAFYIGLAVVAVLVLVAAGAGRSAMVLAGGTAALAFIGAGAVAAFNVAAPEAYGPDIRVVRMWPLWGLAAAAAGALAVLAGGVVLRLRRSSAEP